MILNCTFISDLKSNCLFCCARNDYHTFYFIQYPGKVKRNSIIIRQFMRFASQKNKQLLNKLSKYLWMHFCRQYDIFNFGRIGDAPSSHDPGWKHLQYVVYGRHQPLNKRTGEEWKTY